MGMVHRLMRPLCICIRMCLRTEDGMKLVTEDGKHLSQG